MSKTLPSRPTVMAVVIARGGSKGLPGKNLRPLGGKPLVQWSIEHALASQMVTHTVVSSDSPEILELATSMGVGAIHRPPELANDTATVDSAVRHAVEQWEHMTGATGGLPASETTHRSSTGGQAASGTPTSDLSPQGVDAMVILYGCVAIRPPDLIDRAIEKLNATQCDSVQSVYPVGKTHPYWMKRLVGHDGDQLEAYTPNTVYRRQELPPVYMLNSGVLAVSRKSLFTVDPAQPHAFLGTDRRAIVTGADEVVDIDDELDLALAQAILDKRTQGRSG